MERSRVSRLLQLGLKGRSRYVEDLIQRLREPDGSRWLSSSLESLFPRPAGDPEKLLLKGEATLERLTAMKDEFKGAFQRASEEDQRLNATLGYFLALAAGLVHHGALISKRPRAEVDPVLLDLATAMPDPWADLLARASLIPEATGEP